MPELDSSLVWVPEVEEAYGIRILAVVGNRTVWQVLCNDGRKFIWKWSDGNPGLDTRLRILHRLAAQCNERVLRMAAPVLSRTGSFTAQIQERVGYLQTWQAGRHVNATHAAERIGTLRALSALHQEARALIQREPVLPWPQLYVQNHLVERLQWKRHGLEQLLREWSKRYAIDVVPHVSWLDAADKAIEAASFSGLFTFCHRDLALHNILWEPENQPVFIDFDQSALDNPLLDVMQFANHCIARGGLSADLFPEILEHYHAPGISTEETARSVFQILWFPDILVRSLHNWAQDGFSLELKSMIARGFQIECERQRFLCRLADGTT